MTARTANPHHAGQPASPSENQSLRGRVWRDEEAEGLQGKVNVIVLLFQVRSCHARQQSDLIKGTQNLSVRATSCRNTCKFLYDMLTISLCFLTLFQQTTHLFSNLEALANHSRAPLKRNLVKAAKLLWKYIFKTIKGFQAGLIKESTLPNH